MHVVLRHHLRPHISHIETVQPSHGEVFYLQAILQNHPAQSFHSAHTVNGHKYACFQEATTAMGLFTHQHEAHQAMDEAVQTLNTPYQLRLLYIHMLMNNCIPNPLQLWNIFRDHLALDFTLHANNDVDVGHTGALHELARHLDEYGRKLSDFGLPDITTVAASSEVEHEKRKWRDCEDKLCHCADDTYWDMTHKQCVIYNNVLDAVEHNTPLQLFVDGGAGRGKTFMVNALCSKLQSQGRIVLPTATAAFAAQLYLGGRTTHSTFKVSPIYP